MAAGKTKDELTELGKQTRFSSDRQPENRKKPDSITALIKQELAGDGWAVLQDSEILNEEGKPTGQKATVRVKLTTADAVAKKILQRAMKSSDKLMTELWERIDGKVPLDFNVGGQKDNPLNVNLESLTTDELKAFIALSEKATNGQHG